MNRKEVTKFLSDLLIQQKFRGLGKYYASEVTLYYGHGAGKEKRVDFIQFCPKNQMSVSGLEHGEFICYEIKSCKADFHSGNGLNFEGERNYIVTTMQTYKDIVNEIHFNVGVYVAIPNNRDKYAEFENPTPLTDKTHEWTLYKIKPAHPTNRKLSMTELLFCMLRAGK